jgi:hypothetical protein
MAHTRPDLTHILVDLGLSVDVRPDATPVEIACINGVPQVDANATYNFVRRFIHEDWIDGESLVQATKTPEEAGFNERFHNIERDLDSLGDNVQRAFQSIAALRAQLRVCLNEIVVAMNAGNKNTAKDTKDGKDTPDAKGQKDSKEAKDNKDTPDGKHGKDTKDTKEDKEGKDSDDKDPKEVLKDGLGAAEKKDQDHGPGHLLPTPPSEWDGIIGPRDHMAPVLPTDGLRVFIRPEERPSLGERALNEPRRE